MGGERVRVVQYNILSPSLACFESSSEEDLDATARLQKVKARLKEETKRGSIIALQELAYEWTPTLDLFFEQEGYKFVTAAYTELFAVAIAFPRSKYALVDYKIQRIASLIEHSSQIRPHGKRSMFFRARDRLNAALLCIFEPISGGDEFAVSTYHMPCDFRNQTVMVMHANLYVNWAQQESGGRALIVTGDMNTKPIDPAYRMIVKGSLPLTHPDVMFTETQTFAELQAPMRSVLLEFFGTEPEFTNHCKFPDKPMFKGTLDYIFVSMEWSIDDAVELDEGAEHPIPHGMEPSDHYALWAELSL